MSLSKLCLVVLLLVGGTAAAVVAYVDSRRPVPRGPVAIEHRPLSETEAAELPALTSEDREEPLPETA